MKKMQKVSMVQVKLSSWNDNQTNTKNFEQMEFYQFLSPPLGVFGRSDF